MCSAKCFSMRSNTRLPLYPTLMLNSYPYSSHLSHIESKDTGSSELYLSVKPCTSPAMHDLCIERFVLCWRLPTCMVLSVLRLYRHIIVFSLAYQNGALSAKMSGTFIGSILTCCLLITSNVWIFHSWDKKRGWSLFGILAWYYVCEKFWCRRVPLDVKGTCRMLTRIFHRSVSS